MQSKAVFSTPAVRIGRKWFQYRSLSPVPFFLCMVFLKADFTPSYFQLFGFLSVVFLAEALRIWAVGYAGSVTRTRSDSLSSLVHSGPYRLIRNPLYVANIALYTACGLALGFTKLSVIFFIYTIVQYSLIIRYEEKNLLTAFGSDYERYMKAVSRWVPFTKKSYPSSGHCFSLVKAIRSERTTLLLIGVLWVVLIVKYSN